LGQKVQRKRSGGFFLSKQQRKPRVLTPEVISKIESYWIYGYSLTEICQKLDIKQNTLKKALLAGRVILADRQEETSVTISKSQRNITDNDQPIGKACSNVSERILSALTGISCTINFENQIDLQYAGSLIAIPALLGQGLLRYEQDFELDSKYYPTSSIFLSLSVLALLRIKTLSGVESIPSGELGRTIGLDRIPEVKTLRGRIASFCEILNIHSWSSKLSKDWMINNPELSAVLYIDGHVKLYYGKEKNLPKRYVSRMRLALSGTTDYWVNDVLGQPFFVINKAVNTGLIQTIKDDLLQRFDEDIPNQPTDEQLVKDPFLSRYMLVFDREGYSPDFFFDLWQNRISVATYKKNVKEKWDDNEFEEYTGTLPYGTEQTIALAERGVLLQNKGSEKKIWAREIRKKSASGHQTSIITTNFKLSIIIIGLYMFARWGQENFFKYMMKEFGIDTLTSNLKNNIHATTTLVNPKYRELESLRKKLTSKLTIIKARFATLTLNADSIKEKKMEKYLSEKQRLREEIEYYEKETEIVKEQKKAVPYKIEYSQLPDNAVFKNVINDRKHLLDTIKIIAYRAETAMVNVIKHNMSHKDEARLLLKQIYNSSANLLVDKKNKILNVHIHNLSHWKDDAVLEKLCDFLNETQTKFPDTNMTISYKILKEGSS